MTNTPIKEHYTGKFDLEARTVNFAILCLSILKSLDKNLANSILLKQFIRSATSVGANYHEANECESKRDFIHKISICKKELKETKYWTILLKNYNSNLNTSIFDKIEQENKELLLIFSKIINSSKLKN